jgi:HNH endonuclease
MSNVGDPQTRIELATHPFAKRLLYPLSYWGITYDDSIIKIVLPLHTRVSTESPRPLGRGLLHIRKEKITVLRRADNVTVHSHKFGFFTKKIRVTVSVGRKSYTLSRAYLESEWQQVLQSQQEIPYMLASIDNRHLWYFKGRYYWDNDDLNTREVHALLASKMDRERHRIQRAEALLDTGMRPSVRTRQAIPDDVKHYVWQRDGGQCQGCGSTTELQYDHVIPISLGGGSTEANLQLLCGPCNRRKGAGL